MSDNASLTPAEQASLDEQRNAPPPAEETPQAPPPADVEAPEAPTDDEDAPAAEQRTVPLAALKEERDRRKEVERTSAENQRKWEERFNALLQRVAPPEQPRPADAPSIPTVEQDPVGHIVGTMQQLGHSQEEIRQAIGQRQQQEQQQNLVAAIQQRAVAAETEYRAETPDYDQAVGYLRNFRMQQLRAAGMTDPGQIHAQIMQEAFQVAAHAIQGGSNPAERFYNIAKASGYAPAAAENAPQQDETQRLANISRGQQQSRGLGTVRGSGPAPMTAAKLMEMDEKTFLETMTKSADARKLLGA